MDKSGRYARAATDALLSASTAAAAAAAAAASEGDEDEDEDEDDGGDGAAEEEPRVSGDGCGGEARVSAGDAEDVADAGAAEAMNHSLPLGESAPESPFAAGGRSVGATLRADEAQSASVSRHSATVLEEMVPLSQVALWNRTSVATSMAHRRDDDDNTPPPRSKSPVGDRGGGGGTSETVQTVSTSKKSE